MTGQLTLASTSSNGTKGNSAAEEPSLSADGTKVAFESRSTNLHRGDTDGDFDVYVSSHGGAGD